MVSKFKIQNSFSVFGTCVVLYCTFSTYVPYGDFATPEGSPIWRKASRDIGEKALVTLVTRSES